jgi:linear primary-alkylsulfatase
MAMTLFFDYLGMRLNGANAGDRCSTIVCVLPDLDETRTVTLGHGTLSHRKGADSNPEATLTIKRSDLGQVILGSRPLTEQLKGGQARIEEDVQGSARPNRPARQLRVLVRHRHALTKRDLSD